MTKGSHKGVTLAIYTSGGDAQGMNAAVRAVVRMGLFLGCKVYLIREGYQGMCDGGDNFILADWKSVSGILNLGGTVIGSARCMDFQERFGRLNAAQNLINRGINQLVCIGGDGSLTGADVFRQEWPGLVAELVKENRITSEKADQFVHLQIVGLVGSIDNDFCGTDMTIGTDSALHRIIEAVDNIRPTALSHKRCFILEVMGRHCGYLALIAALASEADWVFIPEMPPEKGWEDQLCNKLSQDRITGMRLNIIIISEGAIDRDGKAITANQVKDLLTLRIKLDTRVTILGHVQRGGNPSAFDRILSSRMGAEAVMALIEASVDSPPCVITIDGNQIMRVPLMEAVARTKAVKTAMDNKNWAEAVQLRGRNFQQNLEVYMLMAKVKAPFAGDAQKTNARNFPLAMMNVGSPCCGMNSAMRAFTCMAMTKSYNVYGISHGFEGLVQNNIQQMKWHEVQGWSCLGGANLGTSKITPDQIGLDKVASQFKKYKLSGLFMIGGFEAFYSAVKLVEARAKYPEFCIPIIVLPACIGNNVPGTEYSLGSDTALNEIMDIADRLRQSALGSKNRVFICETMGGRCGYLATMSALAGGADAAYIFEEPVGIKELMADVIHMAAKMKSGIRRGLILRADEADDIFTTEFIQRLFAREGRAAFSAKYTVIGEIQEGGYPSPFDRNLGTRMGCRCAEKLIDQVLESANSSGIVNTTVPETCTLLGIQKRASSFTPIQEVKKLADFQHHIPKDSWWLKLRPLLRILAKHDSVYEIQSIKGRAREVDVGEKI